MVKRNGATSDVHGSDVRSQSLDEARRETTTSRAMATSVEQPTAPRPAALARLQERMRRGEYPLWLLIFAGLVFGGILAWIAVGYFSANKPLDVPSFRRMEN